MRGGRIAVVETMGSGGMIHYVYQMCTAMAETGATVTLITTSDYELAHLPHNFEVVPMLRLWPMFDAEAAQRTRDTPLGRLMWAARRGWRGARLVVAWTRLVRYLQQLQPDIIQFGKINYPFEGLFLRLLRRNGFRLTQICHEFESRESHPLAARFSQVLSLGLYQNFQAIFLHSQENRDRFLALHQVPGRRMHLIDHGNEDMFLALEKPIPEPELRRRYAFSPEQPVVLFFGNLVPSKGVPDLIEAFSRVVDDCPFAVLLIAGYPSKHFDLSGVRQQVSALGVENAVRFDARYIPLEEVGSLMRLARCVVYPYRSSTQSGSLQVAYSFGRPVVATNVGGLPEVVDPGRSGLLVDPQQPVQLAQAILKLVGDQRLAADMGRYARNLSQTRFAWSTIAGDILEVYDQLAGCPHS